VRAGSGRLRTELNARIPTPPPLRGGRAGEARAPRGWLDEASAARGRPALGCAEIQPPPITPSYAVWNGFAGSSMYVTSRGNGPPPTRAQPTAAPSPPPPLPVRARGGGWARGGKGDITNINADGDHFKTNRRGGRWGVRWGGWVGGGGWSGGGVGGVVGGGGGGGWGWGVWPANTPPERFDFMWFFFIVAKSPLEGAERRGGGETSIQYANVQGKKADSRGDASADEDERGRAAGVLRTETKPAR